MLFCPKCKSILLPNPGNPKKIKCSCGYTLKQQKVMRIGEKTERVKKVDIIDRTIETLPKTEARCPKCNHNKAYYWLAQTRAAD